MSECCNSDQASSEGKLACPNCGQCGAKVKHTTLTHLLCYPKNVEVGMDSTHYFCRTENCDVVYFSDKGSVYKAADVRVAVGQKSSKEDALVCYCFDLTRACLEEDERKGSTRLRDFVEQQTKAKLCACQQRNPSGKCCLADFPKK